MHSNNYKGWTVQQWRQAYQQQQIQIDDLFDYVANFSREDTAWISIASEELLQQQISAVKQQAKLCDDQDKDLPLYGIPFAVKDNIDVVGFVTTAACKIEKNIATIDAETIRLLKKAGAIVVGKTNLDQFATGLVGTRSPFGIVRNCFNAEYVSGGSSSGSASVVARGLVPFALGTDTAGSGRIPAGFNNIVGLKPTKGRFSTRGLMPACRSLDCISIFALTVIDAEQIAQYLEMYDEQDSYSRKHPKNVPAKFSSELHIAIPAQLEFFADAQSAQAFQEAIAQLKACNVKITPIDFSIFRQLAEQLYQGAWVAERTAALQNLLAQHKQAFDPSVLKIVESGQAYSAVEAYQAEYVKQDLARQIQQCLAQFDALVVPTAPTIHRINTIAKDPIARNADFGTYTNFTNLADLSALALPAGFLPQGLPFGITVIAPAWHDQALIEFGKMWQAHLNLPLGALNRHLQPIEKQLPAFSEHHIRVAVVGAHLTAMPLNFQLTSRQAVLIETTHTAANYGLFALKGTVPAKPGLARVDAGHSIAVELWDVPSAYFGEFVAEIPAPLGMGNVELIDGRWVKGFICEPYALEDAEDISHFLGWKAYVRHANQPKPQHI